MARTSRSRSGRQPAGAQRAGRPGTATGPRRPGGASSGGAGTSRSDATGGGRRGRRERDRVVERSFLERYRNAIIIAAVAVAVAIAGVFVFASATSPAYACSAQFLPSPTADPSHQGVIQDDLGRSHVAVGTSVKYALCPPASGNHYDAQGQGPIPPRLYGPNEPTVPQGWVHNLEHGALVVLYRCGNGDTGCSDSTQAAMSAFVGSFPASPVCSIAPGLLSPVVTRFDQMPKPFAALVWGRVLYLDSFDTNAILAFFRQEAERTNPEAQCASPSPSGASPAASAGSSGSPAASPSAGAPASAGASPSPEPSTSASPS